MSAIFLTNANNNQRVLVVWQNINSARVASGMPGDPVALRFSSQCILYVKETIERIKELIYGAEKNVSQGLPGVITVTNFNTQRSVLIAKKNICYVGEDKEMADIKLVCGDLIYAKDSFVQVAKRLDGFEVARK